MHRERMAWHADVPVQDGNEALIATIIATYQCRCLSWRNFCGFLTPVRMVVIGTEWARWSILFASWLVGRARWRYVTAGRSTFVVRLNPAIYSLGREWSSGMCSEVIVVWFGFRQVLTLLSIFRSSFLNVNFLFEKFNEKKWADCTQAEN